MIAWSFYYDYDPSTAGGGCVQHGTGISIFFQYASIVTTVLPIPAGIIG